MTAGQRLIGNIRHAEIAYDVAHKSRGVFVNFGKMIDKPRFLRMKNAAVGAAGADHSR